jgi:hypothetical protein
VADDKKPAQKGSGNNSSGGGKGGGQITIDSAFITDVKNRVMAIRNQITSVRSGVNPNDVAHPHGMSLATIKLLAGAGSFQAGTEVNRRLGAVGQQVDQKLGDLDQRLATYGQDLDHLIGSADKVEVDNMSLSDLDKYIGNMGGTGQSAGASALGGSPPPPTPPATPAPAEGATGGGNNSAAGGTPPA